MIEASSIIRIGGVSIDVSHPKAFASNLEKYCMNMRYALEYDEEMLYLQPVASGYRIMPLRYGRSEVTVVATDEGGLAGRDTFAGMCRDESREVDLYPNPVRDRLSIRMGRDVEGALRVTLCDAAGRRAFAAEVRIAPTAPAVVDLSSLGGGTYTIELRYEGGSLTRSIVKL